VERAGGLLWNRLEPLGRRFLPVKTPTQAFLLGLIWGWLPCGLVYSVLVWSISTADPLYGAALLFSFGLGTLPNLLLMGVAAAGLSARVRDPRTRRIAGSLVVLFGLYSLYRLIR
jgi:sulfite exporter TauE/SafE